MFRSTCGWIIIQKIQTFEVEVVEQWVYFTLREPHSVLFLAYFNKINKKLKLCIANNKELIWVYYGFLKGDLL